MTQYLPQGPTRTYAWFLLGILVGLAPLAPAQSQPMIIKNSVRFDAGVLGYVGTGNSNLNDNFGRAAASLGDLDGDGVTDIVFGHSRDDDVDDPAKLGGQGVNSGKYNQNGAIWIIYLNADGTVKDKRTISATSPDAPPLDQDNGPPGVDGQDNAGVRGFGQAIDNIGDLDGDGVIDLIVGVNEDDEGTTGQTCTTCSNTNSPIDVGFGSLFVLFMNMDGTIKNYQKISKTQGGVVLPDLGIKEFFGAAVASMGDFNDDGLKDILVGAPGTHKFNPTTQLPFPSPLSSGNSFDPDNEHVSGTGLGRVWILSLNPDGTVAKRVPIDMPQVGDPIPNDPDGKLYGSDKALDGAFSNEYGDEFGRSVAWLGDLDGDTLDPDDPDDVDSMTTIAVGAPFDDDGPPNPQGRYGAIWILGIDLINGVPKIVESQKISAFHGNYNAALSRRDLFGISMDPAGDWNKDGVPDLVVGTLFDDDGWSDAGAVSILLLNRNGTVKSHMKISNSPHGLKDPLVTNQKGVNFGASVANIGDFDGNGTIDFIAGAELYDNLNRGAGWLVTTDVPRLALGDRLDAVVAPNNGYKFTFEATKGTRIKMAAAQVLSGMEPAIRILGPLIAGQEPDVLVDIADSTSKKNSPKARRKAKVPKKFAVPATGEYLVEVLDVGGQGGAFRMKTKGKAAKDVRKIVQIVEIGNGEETFEVSLDAVAGTLLKKLSIKTLKPKGDFAVVNGVAAALKPMVDAVLTPGSAPLLIEDLLKVNATGTQVSLKKLPLDGLGTYTVEVSGADQSVGYALLRASVKIPRSREKIVLP
jgi:hypothetical protein